MSWIIFQSVVTESFVLLTLFFNNLSNPEQFLIMVKWLLCSSKDV